MKPTASQQPSAIAALEHLRLQAERHAARAPVGAGLDRPAAELAHELHVHRIELEMQNEELRQAQVALEESRDRYVDLYDFAPAGNFTLNAEGLIVAANLTGAALLGVERGRLQGSRFALHIAAADHDRWHRYAITLMRHGEPARIELDLLRRDGLRWHAQIDGLRVLAPSGQAALRITLTDISERRRAETALRLEANAFKTHDAMMITDHEGVIEVVNEAFTQVTGYGPEEAVGHNARLLKSGRHDHAFFAALWNAVQRAGAWQGEVWNRRKDGTHYPAWLTVTAVRDDDAAPARYVCTLVDKSQQKLRDDEIAQLAFYDALTGLPNRRLMRDRLNQAIAASTRSRRLGALLYIDVDRFKEVNDRLGHDKGDLLLQQIAQRLSGCVREGDSVARLGGDEFVVMLAADLSNTPEEAAAQTKIVGEKILSTLSAPHPIGGIEHHGSVSIGITLFSGNHFPAEELLMRADQAMYQAKTAGRNTLRFFDSSIEQLLGQRAALESDLRQAVRQSEFVLHYQPEFSREGRLLGAEALVRWQHPERGLVAPTEFIGVAEDTGLIHALGPWVLQTACAQLAAWAADAEMAHLHLSVNISARQLRDKQFVQQVLEHLSRSGADPSQLKLELTESVMLDNVDDTIAKMEALKAHGVGFSLDDFGTGYSSLAYLKRLPLDQLKIDKSFVRDVLIHAHDAAIARTIVELGNSLGLRVVAEGIESEGQRELLAGFGCHCFQGYLLGRPAPAEALREAVRQSL